MTEDDRYVYEYDYKNRLARVSKKNRYRPGRLQQLRTYTYDVLGRRSAIYHGTQRTT